VTDITGYSVYVPQGRLQRGAITELLGSRAGKGTRSVASFDEDSTSMAVEAARPLVQGSGIEIDSVVFSTTSPAYADKTNASTIHAALQLGAPTAAYDFVGAVRSATGALRMALAGSANTLVVAGDVRSGLPGGADESGGGDAAVAFMIDDTRPPIVSVESWQSASAEFLDRWRTPGEVASKVWEERFGEMQYGPLIADAAQRALAEAGIELDAVDHVVLSGTHPRALRSAGRGLLAGSSKPAVDLDATVGNSGVADLGLRLAEVLDRAESGDSILVVSASDGVEAFVLRATDALADARPARSVQAAIELSPTDVTYADFLTWRGLLHREPPRRPEPDSPAGPPSARSEDWKFGFVGTRCDSCGTGHLPPQRVCVRCDAVDQMSPEPFAEVAAHIATFTIDRLTYSLSPPVVAAVVDFEGGGRYDCEMTDVDPESVAIGNRVEMTFRRLSTGANGVHNYFWKARPYRGQ